MPGTYFCDEQIAEFRECFELFDKDQDGAVSLEELRCVWRALGMEKSEWELRDMLRRIGADEEEGIIDFVEFLSMMRLPDEPPVDDGLFQLFAQHDPEHTGEMPLIQMFEMLGDCLMEDEYEECTRELRAGSKLAVTCRGVASLGWPNPEVWPAHTSFIHDRATAQWLLSLDNIYALLAGRRRPNGTLISTILQTPHLIEYIWLRIWRYHSSNAPRPQCNGVRPWPSS